VGIELSRPGALPVLVRGDGPPGAVGRGCRGRARGERNAASVHTAEPVSAYSPRLAGVATSAATTTTTPATVNDRPRPDTKVWCATRVNFP
jgi:hypothetical protein